MKQKKIDPAFVRNLDIRSLSIDLDQMADPTSLVYKDPEHIKDIEARYGANILTLATIVDKERHNGRL